jgi:hypothetical protein
MAEIENDMDIADNAVLEPKLVGDVAGEFYVPAYQRGYRWGTDQIKMLLNDIWENGDSNYCLQPIVVKRNGEAKFELIDGQQRLTSIYLILKYMKQLLPFIEMKFSLSYQTRDRSAEFLLDLDSGKANENIDFYHMYNAYQYINTWFEDNATGDKGLKAINLYKYFGEKVKFIWYEVNSTEDSTELFTRLNIGKIPLTNAELVKALFLSKDNNSITDEKQLEISTSWDIIEKELHNKDLWAFLTNEYPEKFATRIELLFNMMSSKKPDEKESFFTFFYFIEKMKTESKIEIWKEIQEYFLTLKEWFDKSDVYHKVGYLVAVGEDLQKIISNSINLTKSDFQDSLDNKIKLRLNLTKEKILELNYENKNDKPVIEKLLLLFNVETISSLKHSFERYSFESHKRKSWSLEHIHAQNSIGLNKKEEQQEWLRLHRASLIRLQEKGVQLAQIGTLIKQIDEHYETITKVIFDLLFAEVFTTLSENDDRSYMDSISNMALLRSADNSALNNSTFDVKRNKILDMDKDGEYIPICTRRIFLKYYTESKNHQLHFWGVQDREAYMDAMIGKEGILVKYLLPTTKAIIE